jgi:hypothetical protein
MPGGYVRPVQANMDGGTVMTEIDDKELERLKGIENKAKCFVEAYKKSRWFNSNLQSRELEKALQPVNNRPSLNDLDNVYTDYAAMQRK